MATTSLSQRLANCIRPLGGSENCKLVVKKMVKSMLTGKADHLQENPIDSTERTVIPPAVQLGIKMVRCRFLDSALFLDREFVLQCSFVI